MEHYYINGVECTYEVYKELLNCLGEGNGKHYISNILGGLHDDWLLYINGQFLHVIKFTTEED